MKTTYTWNIELIDNYIKSNNLSKTQFCKLCGISTYILKKLYLGDMHIGVEAWLNITNFLNIHPLNLLKRTNI